MSTIHVGHSHPNAARRRLAKLLAVDELRPRPPVTLPGKPDPQLPALPPPPSSSSSPPLPSPSPSLPRSRTHRSWLRYLNRPEPQRQAAEIEPEDVIAGAWTREQRLQMDAAFVRRVERTFRRGAESRTAAGATMTPRRGRT
jgi:hypothetical protein